MDTNSIGFLLLGPLGSAMGLALFIYLGNQILDFMKSERSPAILRNRLRIDTAAWRRDETRPTIICSLPMHQQRPRHEDPLY